MSKILEYLKKLFSQSVKNIFHLKVAFLSALFYGFPGKKIKIIGVTGTDGKTTTVNLIHHLLKTAGYKVSMISSVNAVIGEKSYDTGFHVTTPDSRDVQRYIRRAVDAG